MSQANIDVVELGFRFPIGKSFIGAHGYTSDELLDSLDFPDGLMVGVMLNAKDAIQNKNFIKESFKPANQSKINIVRIAAHMKEILQCEEAVEQLCSLGFGIGGFQSVYWQHS